MCFNFYAAAIPASLEGQKIVTVAADDPDLDSKLTYSLDDTQYFTIVPTTGEIYSRANIEGVSLFFLSTLCMRHEDGTAK